MLGKIFLAFIPIFVAVDAIGLLPIFVSLTKGTAKKERFNIIVQSLVTAACLATGFIFLGKAIFNVLGVTIGDFMIAGGAVLFCLSMIDLLMPGKKGRVPAKELGAVPLGTPLIVGPAVLTTSLMIIPVYGLYATLIAVLINIVLAGLILMFSGALMRVLGEAGTRALSKVMNLLLAAIAVMMMRRGVLYLIAEFR